MALRRNCVAGAARSPQAAARRKTFSTQCKQSFVRQTLVLFFFTLTFAALCAHQTQAATINVHSGGDLQAAFNVAQPGDTILLDAGATFVGSFTLPYKAGTNTDADWITVRTSASDSSLPASGQRLTPAYANVLAKIATPGSGASALHTQARAHHWRFIGIEFKPTDANAVVYDLVDLGDGSAAQNSLDQVPHHFIFDRCYFHGDPAGSLKRGIGLNSAETSILNSYFAEFKLKGQDSQAICGWNGPGPFHIVNNYIEASTENILFGGADPTIPNLVPSDIEIRRNYLTKQLAWRGVWQVKNLLELKNAQHVTIDGNVIENDWADAQGGTAVLFTVRNQDGNAPWSVVQNVTFTNNILRHAGSGINLLGQDYNYPSQITGNVTISNNLVYDLSASWGGNGKFMIFTGVAHDVKIAHNTVVSPADGFTVEDNVKVTNLSVTDNIFQMHFLASGNAGVSALQLVCGSAYQMNGNAIVMPTSRAYWQPQYPSANTFADSFDQLAFVNPDVNSATPNFSLGSSSPARGRASDGKDAGADMSALAAAQSGSTQPAPLPTPTPTATPTPNATPTPTPNPTPVPTPTPSSTPAASQAVYRFAVSASGGFASDTAFATSATATYTNTYSVTDAIDLSAASAPAPQAVYQNERFGEINYVMTKLQAGATYTLRLHFAELYFTSAKQRLFDIVVNGQTLAHDFDIFAAAGARDRAVVKEFQVTADSSGQIALNLHYGSANHPKINGVELFASSPIDINDPATFVAQQYADFFGRTADSSGLSFWTATLKTQIAQCPAGSNRAACVTQARAQVSAAFFLSTEFQQTGYLLIRYYMAVYGRLPTYQEFMTDHAKLAAGVVVGQTGWESILAANNESFVASLLARSDVASRINSLSNADYVALLMKQADVQDAEESDLRYALANGLSAGSETRASVLERVAGCTTVYNRQYNPAFVLMQYFGYLRRDPQAPPDNSLAGFNFWLSKLNANSAAGANLETSSDGLTRARRAQMIEAFISSDEYLARFKK